MKLRAISEATTAVRDDLRKSLGNRNDLTLADVPAEHRELARAIVGDAPRFSARDLEVGLEDAYIALRRADEKALLGFLPRAGWRDGTIQPSELAHAQKQSPAASPLYRMIENRVAAYDRASAAVKAADSDARKAFAELLDALGPQQREAVLFLSLGGYEQAAKAFELGTMGEARAHLEARLDRGEGTVFSALEATRQYLVNVGGAGPKLRTLEAGIRAAFQRVEDAKTLLSETERDQKVAKAVVHLETLQAAAWNPRLNRERGVTGGEVHAAKMNLEHVRQLPAVTDAEKARAVAEAEKALEAYRPRLTELVKAHAPMPRAEIDALATKVGKAVEKCRAAEAMRASVEVHAEPIEHFLFRSVDDGSYYLKRERMFPHDP